jgi:hypothetical protein
VEGNEMIRATLPTTLEGLTVPREVLDDAGVKPGEQVEIEIDTLPGPKEILRLAGRHTVWRLGMAIQIGWPCWQGDRWVIELASPDGTEVIGHLVYTDLGELVEDQSDTLETLRTTGRRSAQPAGT